MTYWYTEYIEKDRKYVCVGESKTNKPNITKLIPNIGLQNISVLTLIEISKDDFNIIYSRMSGFNKSNIEK